MRKSVTLIAIFAAMTFLGCAGRDAVPVTLVQPQDQVSSCSMIAAEIEANNQKVQQLADEKGIKVAQNVAAGVGGPSSRQKLPATPYRKHGNRRELTMRDQRDLTQDAVLRAQIAMANRLIAEQSVAIARAHSAIERAIESLREPDGEGPSAC